MTIKSKKTTWRKKWSQQLIFKNNNNNKINKHTIYEQHRNIFKQKL